jgi:long-chain acyl-CoA synthetase
MFAAPSLSAEADINPEQFKSIVDVFEFAFKHHADKPAFNCLGHTLTFKELDECSARLANWFVSESGLHAGDRIAIQLPNLLQFPVTAIAAARAGLVIVTPIRSTLLVKCNISLSIPGLRES